MKPDIHLFQNLLPFGDRTFEALVNDTVWEQHVIKVYGNEYPEPRLTALYGDAEYTYSHTKRLPLPWTYHLLQIKQLCERTYPAQYNSCLLNFYRDGNDSIGLHADNEPELGEQPIIATFSLGGPRVFELISNCKQYHEQIVLGHGDLLIMAGNTQQHWKHTIRKSKKHMSPRISLTFRKVFDNGKTE